jgi:hypothetical protein
MEMLRLIEMTKLLKTALTFACLAMLALMVACSDEMGDWLSGFDADDSSAVKHDILTGRVVLEGANEHDMIRVELTDVGVSMLTDVDGYFQLPTDLSDGDWTLQASYPYFHPAEQSFRIVKGVPESELDTFSLSRSVAFTITTNGNRFRPGSVVQITLAAENVSTNDEILSSNWGPAATFAVMHKGQIVFGDLFPGNMASADEVLLSPGDTVYDKMQWEIDAGALLPGDYALYGIIATGATHPDYFDDSSEDLNPFNQSLYSKLTAAIVEVE